MKAWTLCLLVSCTVSSEASAGSWSDLWRTPEQQGQQLLDSNHAAAAARLLKDPQRRGYAELRAGDYAQAAKSLAPLHDVDSLYNRGNALAHTGQLQEALAAYDAALAQSPGNRDVVRNRDLVAHALEQERKQSGGNQQQGNGGGKQNAASPGQSGNGSGQSGNAPGSQSRAGGQSQAGAQDRSQAASQAQSQSGTQSAPPGQPGAQGQRQAGSQAQNQAGAQSPSAGQLGARNSAQASQTPASTSNSQAASPALSQPQQGPGSESQVAQASPANTNSFANGEARPAQRGNAPPGTDPVTVKNGGRTVGTAQPSRPLSEQSLALDQWLRGIPDDSAELLRRKFLIEHMMKEQGNGP